MVSLSTEAIVGIVGLLLALPASILLVWKTIKRRERNEVDLAMNQSRPPQGSSRRIMNRQTFDQWCTDSSLEAGLLHASEIPPTADNHRIEIDTIMVGRTKVSYRAPDIASYPRSSE